ncbi:MAG: hypothetical protein HRF50_13990 [Phycisphaerae bacterium]|jgi:spermidine synthase
MNAARPEAPPRAPEAAAPLAYPSPLVLCVALTSAALIAYEIVLMRRMLVERWHHFGYLVISLALLGFGASGTLLALAERSVRRRPSAWMYGLALALVAALVAAPRLGAAVPITVRFIPQDLAEQAGWWALYAACALTPFLSGAALLGVALMTAGRSVERVYAANLVGSAAGAAGGVLVLSHYPIEAGLWPSLALTVAAALCAGLAPDGGDRLGARRRRAVWTTSALALGALSAALECAWPLQPAYDEHKYGAYLRRLAEQGSARRIAAAFDPHGAVELYESALFHDLPFAALGVPPPPLLSVAIDGDAAGSVLRIESAEQAAVVDDTLMALPYSLIRSRPRVLLLGEVGGANVWLARRRGAKHVTLVQPNAALLGLLRRHAPTLLAGEDVSALASEPRRYIETNRIALGYDLVQIAALEGLGVGAAGMRGLAEDHLATVEGIAACLAKLHPGGVLAVCRGVQFPERENIRLLATMVEALETLGVRSPAAQVVQVRDYLGVCTMALRSPLSDEQRDALRATLRERKLTPVWFDGIRLEEVNQPDALPGPPGERADWLHYAAREIVADADPIRRRARRETFYVNWMLNVRPACDDRPFFWDFFKPRGVAELRRVYGDLWLTRAELGRLFLYASLAAAGATSVLLILLPFAIQRAAAALAQVRDECARERSGVAAWRAMAYFAAIGLGFMGIEMALISRATAFVGDPVLASAAVIAGVLLLSGLGSLTADRLFAARPWAAPLLVAALAALVCVLAYSSAPASGGMLPAGAAGVAVAFLMGAPMPVGLRRLEQAAPSLTPWAWGVNGVCSVIATSGAVVVAMEWGYREVLIAAAACYLAAAGAAVAFVAPRAAPADRIKQSPLPRGRGSD